MQFRDLQKQYEVLKPEMDAAMIAVASGAHFISGEQVKTLEERLAAYVGRKHCITCGNGTDALELCMMAWGVGPGDAVFVPDFTFFASGEAVSTMGGNIAENSGGLRGLKYGTTKKYVMGLEVLTETGEIMKTGACGRGCEYGYNLTELLVASEGTLALTSKAVLKLVTPPKASKAMMAIFSEVKRASQAVAGIIAAHVVPCTLEFMDNATINYVEDYVNIGLPRDAAAILLIEVDGHPAQVADEAVSVEKVLKDSGALEVVVAKDAAEKTRIWEARRVAIPALARCRPTLMLEDATVPRSKIPAMLEALDKIAARHHVTIGTFGHAGDGNLHPSILCDKRDREEFSRVERAVDDLFNVALELGGTLSGEHGIGTSKKKWLELETSKGTLEYMRRMRSAFDPKKLLNASKIVSL